MGRKVGEGKAPILPFVTMEERWLLCHSLLPDHISTREQRWFPDFIPGTLLGEEFPEYVT